MNVRSIVSTYCPSFLRPVLNRIVDSPVGLRLARGVFWSMVGALISKGLMLVAMILVARMFDKSTFGELGLIRQTIRMFGVLAGFGMGVTATKFVAEFRENDRQRAGHVIGLSGLLGLLIGILMAGGLLLLAPWLAKNTFHDPALVSTLRIAALVLFINALNGAQNGALAGMEAFKTIASVNLLVGLLSFPILVCGAWLGQRHSAGLDGTVWALAVIIGIHALLNHLALRKETRKHNIPLTLKHCTKEISILWTFSAPAVITSIMAAPVFWLSKSILANRPNGFEEVAVVVVAESWRMIPFFICMTIAQANLPVLSQLYSSGDLRRFKKALFLNFCLTGAVVTLGACAVVVLSTPIMASYGADFANDSFVLVLIILSTIPMQLQAVVVAANRCMGKIWVNVCFNAIWAACFMLATVLLVEDGAVGIAWATLIAYSIRLAVSMVYFTLVIRIRLRHGDVSTSQEQET
ncbi:MAG: oligosaccharide flippase family protein [Planctomycetes bacterium]|nr:oligosaccharide flippase family protein [Planctomycetota bacterium]